MSLIITTMEQGFIYGILALGVYITYKILDFPDLTVDGSFPLGGAVGSSGRDHYDDSSVDGKLTDCRDGKCPTVFSENHF